MPAPEIALSAREREVLVLLAEGFTNREIADQLSLAPVIRSLLLAPHQRML
jgi:DNA-binding CsgD family transcriptional regulator